IDIKLVGRAFPDPLAVANDDVKIRLREREILEDLILVAAPGDLVDVDLDAGFLREILPELAQAFGRRPLGPPDRDRLFAGARRRARIGFGTAGQQSGAENGDKNRSHVSPDDLRWPRTVSRNSIAVLRC